MFNMCIAITMCSKYIESCLKNSHLSFKNPPNILPNIIPISLPTTTHDASSKVTPSLTLISGRVGPRILEYKP